VPTSPPSLFSRIWLSWVTAFRIVFDGVFATQVIALARPELGPARSQPASPAPAAPPAPVTPPEPSPRKDTQPAVALTPTESAEDGAKLLLRLLQRDGRFVDFVQQDITSFGDSDVAAAARVVHEGCRRALGGHAKIAPVRPEAEGSKLTLDANEAARVKLIGEVTGKPPFSGVLRHRGWRLDSLKLPTRVGDHDPAVLADAEVEL
jgi:hypothetical protein